MAKPPGKCIFCESSGMTKEHVLPNWLAELFPREQEDHYLIGTIEPSAIQGIPRITTHSRPGRSGTVKTRTVCATCNNGWLSRLEAKSRPVLARMILGERCHLGPDDLNVLAAWAAKTTMTAESKEPRSDGTTQAERSHLMQKLRPPPHWFVWAMAYKDEAWRELTLFQSRGNLQKTPVRRPSTEVHYIQATTIGMGHVVFCSIGTTCPESEMVFGRVSSDAIVQLWPGYPRSALWPPATIATAVQVNAMANILSTTFKDTLNPLAGWTFAP